MIVINIMNARTMSCLISHYRMFFMVIYLIQGEQKYTVKVSFSTSTTTVNISHETIFNLTSKDM